MIRPPLKTVRIESKFFPDGVVINAGDFNPNTDKLQPDPEPVADKAPATDKASAK